ncbi:ATP-dependent Zn protease [Rhizobium sp. BK226]|uniref:AAA family ATPase n=1 Tax=Rhizobium sp. BK226 TaxID=2587075 RepID=UPI00161E4D01|nr:AAA family ATPase [Rhizobium sp. BK226]MBB4113219.1 ATP-dependent Zn protease [Rhizobium sp. BK226]
MRTVPLSERASTLEVQTYAFAVRSALRRGRVFLPENRLVGLRLPPGGDMDAYKDAAETILKSAGLEKYTISMVIVTSGPREADARDAIHLSRYKAALIVLIQDGADIPSELMVALDRIIDVAAVNARHLVAAAKSIAMNIPLEIARRLAAFPASMLFLALRPGRPLDTVLEKLESTALVHKQIPKPPSWEPRIDDLEGYGKAKEWALDLVTDLSDWRDGRITWSDVASGILLSGPPGTGKTMFAEAVARSCGANFIPASSAVWQSKGHLGDMLAAMRRSFEKAAKTPPTVLLIDEIDSIGDRAKFRGHNTDYSIQVVNALLELLDGSGGREGVIVVAATNYPEQVDPALRRPGRLDRHVAIELPDEDTRAKIIAMHLGDGASPDELKTLAAATVGRSGAQLRQLVGNAKRRARRKGRDVRPADLIAMIPPVRHLTEQERRIASTHEAGHAVVGIELGVAIVDGIVVLPQVSRDDGVQGYVQWRRERPLFRSRKSYRSELAMLLGGLASERTILGESFDGSGGGADSDLHRATNLATIMAVSLGMGGVISYSHASSSDELAKLRREDAELRRLVERLLSEALNRACEIIRRRREDVERLVRMLCERGVVTGDELRAMGLDGQAGS